MAHILLMWIEVLINETISHNVCPCVVFKNSALHRSLSEVLEWRETRCTFTVYALEAETR